MRNRLRIFGKLFKVRLLISFLLIFMISLLACFWLVYQFVVGWIQWVNEKNALDGFAKVENSIDWVLESAVGFSNMIQSDALFQQYMNREYEGEEARRVMAAELLYQMDKQISVYSMFNTIIFFQGDGQIGGTSPYRSYFSYNPAHPFYQSNEYKEALENPTKFVWAASKLRYYYSQSVPFSQENNKDILIAGIRSLKQVTTNPEDVLLVSLSESVLRRFYEQLAEEETSIVLLDEQGRMFSGMPIQDFGKVAEYFENISPDKQYGSFSYATEQKNQIIFYKMETTGWLMVKIIPTRIYEQDLLLVRNRLFLFVLVTLFAGLAVVTILIFHFTKPIEKLTQTMATAGKGSLDIRAATNTGLYETDELSKAFNGMFDDINDLFHKVLSIEAEKTKLEIEALQNQIRPHFLYNTITSIRWMATLSGAEGVANALITLIKLLRPVFNSRELFWSIGEEISFLEDYTALMKMRCGKDVLFEVHSLEEGKHIIIPRFLLQPAVENCFEHALKNRNALHIQIHIHTGNNAISVEDNGSGMTEEQLDVLRQKMEALTEAASPGEEEANRNGIGLRNCHRRLRLLYGAGAGISMSSSSTGGTKACFHLRGE